jgi:hydrogenase maturation protease
VGNNKVVILGLGNPLFTDEGLGVHLVHALAPGLPAGIEWIDGGTDGLGLLRIVEQASHLLILDAVDAGEASGTVIELSGEELPKLQRIKLSQHQLGFQEVLGLAAFNGRTPEKMVLIGVQPHSLEWGCELSQTISALLPDLITRINSVIEDWGFPQLFSESMVANDYRDWLGENPLVGAGLRVIVENSTLAGINAR